MNDITKVREKINRILTEDISGMVPLLCVGLAVYAAYKISTKPFWGAFEIEEIASAAASDPNMMADEDVKLIITVIRHFEQGRKKPNERFEMTDQLAKAFKNIKKKYPDAWAAAVDKTKQRPFKVS